MILPSGATTKMKPSRVYKLKKIERENTRKVIISQWVGKEKKNGSHAYVHMEEKKKDEIEYGLSVMGFGSLPTPPLRKKKLIGKGPLFSFCN